MKKLLAFPLALALLLPLCACGAGEAGETASPAVSVSVQTVSQDCRSGDAADVVLLHYADDVPTVTIKNGEAAQTAINTALQELVSAFSEGSGDGTDGLNAYLNMNWRISSSHLSFISLWPLRAVLSRVFCWLSTILVGVTAVFAK